MIPGLPAGTSLQTSAAANTTVGLAGAGGGISVGGINTGTQGIDLQTMLVLAGAAAVLLLLFRR